MLGEGFGGSLVVAPLWQKHTENKINKNKSSVQKLIFKTSVYFSVDATY